MLSDILVSGAVEFSGNGSFSLVDSGHVIASHWLRGSRERLSQSVVNLASISAHAQMQL